MDPAYQQAGMKKLLAHQENLLFFDQIAIFSSFGVQCN